MIVPDITLNDPSTFVSSYYELQKIFPTVQFKDCRFSQWDSSYKSHIVNPAKSNFAIFRNNNFIEFYNGPNNQLALAEYLNTTLMSHVSCIEKGDISNIIKKHKYSFILTNDHIYYEFEDSAFLYQYSNVGFYFIKSLGSFSLEFYNQKQIFFKTYDFTRSMTQFIKSCVVAKPTKKTEYNNPENIQKNAENFQNLYFMNFNTFAIIDKNEFNNGANNNDNNNDNNNYNSKRVGIDNNDNDKDNINDNDNIKLKNKKNDINNKFLNIGKTNKNLNHQNNFGNRLMTRNNSNVEQTMEKLKSKFSAYSTFSIIYRNDENRSDDLKLSSDLQSLCEFKIPQNDQISYVITTKREERTFCWFYPDVDIENFDILEKFANNCFQGKFFPNQFRNQFGEQLEENGIFHKYVPNKENCSLVLFPNARSTSNEYAQNVLSYVARLFEKSGIRNISFVMLEDYGNWRPAHIPTTDGFPMFILWKPADRQPYIYKGNVTVADLVYFVAKYINVKVNNLK